MNNAFAHRRSVEDILIRRCERPQGLSNAHQCRIPLNHQSKHSICPPRAPTLNFCGVERIARTSPKASNGLITSPRMTTERRKALRDFEAELPKVPVNAQAATRVQECHPRLFAFPQQWRKDHHTDKCEN